MRYGHSARAPTLAKMSQAFRSLVLKLRCGPLSSRCRIDDWQDANALRLARHGNCRPPAKQRCLFAAVAHVNSEVCLQVGFREKRVYESCSGVPHNRLIVLAVGVIIYFQF
jgi:hypothetical protein